MDYSKIYSKDYGKDISVMVFNFTSKVKHDLKKKIPKYIYDQLSTDNLLNTTYTITNKSQYTF